MHTYINNINDKNIIKTKDIQLYNVFVNEIAKRSNVVKGCKQLEGCNVNVSNSKP